MNPLVPYIWVAGGVQLLIAASNFLLPSRLRYRENLSRLAPIVRQIFVVHSVYLVLILALFSALCFLYAPELAGGTPLGKFLSACLAMFWLLRILIQFFYYDPAIKKRNRFANFAFTAAISYLGGIFSAAAIGVVK